MVGCTLDRDWPRYVVAALISLFGGVIILLPIKLAWQVLDRRRRRRRLTTVSRLESTLCRLQSGAERVLDGSSTGNKIIVRSVHSRHLFVGVGNPQTYNPLQTADKLYMCSISFFGRHNELQPYHEHFLLMDNKHRKLFVIKQSKGCKFMPKMHQNAFGGRAPPGPAGDLMRSHIP